MTPLERYKHLTEYWNNNCAELERDLHQAREQYEKWYARLLIAEKAEKLAAEGWPIITANTIEMDI